MTLTLEDLKNVRFPIAKKNGEGYRAVEVDAFLDQVDETFSTLLDENSRLKAQLDGLGGEGASAGVKQGGDDALRAENDRLKAQVAELQKAAQSGTAAPSTNTAELDRLRTENNDLRAQLQQAQNQAAQGVAQSDGTVRMVVSTPAEASPAVTRLVQLATEQAEAVLSEANAQANLTIGDATARAQQITLDAQTIADQLQSEAQANADQVNRDAAIRRREMFGSLEREREQLTGKVEALRAYEADYRNSLIQHHQRSIEALNQGNYAPAGAPQVSSTLQGDSSRTPRLDALLAENN